jgi:hypothetical protein
MSISCHVTPTNSFLVPNGSDHPLVPLNLLLFALETAVTTLTCVVEMSSWPGYTAAQRADLYALYVPYLVVGEFVSTSNSYGISIFHLLTNVCLGPATSACLMGIDSFCRVKTQISRGLEDKEKAA